ncbi:hypothetical protein PENSPDRAFT_649895 [Peniophora sp. CONT]|nr:hypothetical protein PENSPDRAFT_649895 [Peniophora sp. CONT]
MAATQHSTATLPPSTFSFNYTPTTLPTKARRTSLALPSAPREVTAWRFADDTRLPRSSTPEHELEHAGARRGKMRRLDSAETGSPEKKIRRKWTMEETQQLVDGCNKHGVGNWKAILNDPTFAFEGRSPVDLKDRFRTYFPDAYKQHYPNAKTHLSSKVRAALPDGSSLFEKTRSKKRRPFTPEEDAALKAGYDKHGTVWATIVKDPIFAEQNRRSTDLRDRFRNAFPELYQAAGYKPRTAPKKKNSTGPEPRAVTDEQIPTESGPARRKRRHTTQGFLRGGTKSVPLSPNASEDETSDEEDPPGTMPVSSSAVSPSMLAPPPPSSVKSPAPMLPTRTSSSTSASLSLATPASARLLDGDADMIFVDDPPSMDFSSMNASDAEWSNSGVHSSASAAWSASPGSAHGLLFGNDFNMNLGAFPASHHQQIGKSAWGPQDWLAGASRMDTSMHGSPDTGAPFLNSFVGSPSPYGVVDRYDLFPGSGPLDYASASDAGADSFSVSAFSDPEFGMGGGGGWRGFTHHSRTAGDLIFGARTHQPAPGNSDYGPGFGFGSGMPGIDEIPGTAHGQGIDDIELSAISLNEPSELAGPSGSQEPPPEVPRTPPPRNAVASSSTAGRSLSVPPTDHGHFVGAPPLTPTRSLSMDVHSTTGAPSADLHALLMGLDAFRPPGMGLGAGMDVPFLDLHYPHYNPAYAEPLPPDSTLALDLANVSMHHPPAVSVGQGARFASLGAEAAKLAGTGAAGVSRGRGMQGSHHARGVSQTVAPLDTIAEKVEGNKRKRASWDGAR